jgi:hypothetical protein
MAIYRTHYVDPIHGSFGIVVDDETMTWTSDPPGRSLEKAVTAYFSRGGPPGSGRTFTVLPNGGVQPV